MGFWNGENSTRSRSTTARGPPGVGFKLTANGNYDLSNKRLTNVAKGVNNQDVVTKSKLEKHQGAIFRDIDLQKKYNILNSKQRNYADLKTHYDSLVSWEDVAQNFLSKTETFPSNTALNMNNHKVYNLPNATQLKDAVPFGQFSTELAKKLSKSGDTMSADLDMNGNSVKNLPLNPTDNREAISKGFFTTELAVEIVKVQNEIDAEALKLLPLDGSRSMSGDLNMNSKKILNLPAPTLLSEPATKSYVDKSHLSQSGIQKN